jgi:endonuclease/exonuclease/phosphatase family metal-dependent hydrolase
MTLPAPGEPAGAIRGAVCWLGRQFFLLVLVLWMNGVILRLTIRDSNDLVAPLFYLTPWPVLAVLTLAFIWTFRRQPKAVFAVIVVAHLFGMAWIMESLKPVSGKRTEPGHLRIVQWNVGRPKDGPAHFVEKLRGYDADIIAVNEPFPLSRAGIPRAETERAWRSAFPDYDARFSSSDLLLLVRGEIERHSPIWLDVGSKAHEADVAIGGHRVALLHIDVAGKLRLSRREAIRKITDRALQPRDRPLIVLGDFNVPVDSVHLDELRKTHRNAFQTAGEGSIDTWPSFLPVLSIDQIWLGSDLRAVKARNGFTLRSDHRPVMAEVRFDEAGAIGAAE